MKALFEFEFEPKTFIDDETLKNDFHNDWNEYMKWQYEQEGFGIFTNDATFVKVITDENNNMPTNDDTPTIETFMGRFAAYCDRDNREIEYDTSNCYEGWDEAKAALQNLIDRARVDELKDYSRVCGILRVEPTTRGLKDRIEVLQTKIKEGE